MFHFDLKSAHDGVEGRGLVVDDVCWKELSGQVFVECSEVMGGIVSCRGHTAFVSLSRCGYVSQRGVNQKVN